MHKKLCYHNYMDKKISIYKLVCGEIKEFCYIIDVDGEGIIIDPGQAVQKIRCFLQKNNIVPKVILLTHAHYDHAYACKYLQSKGAKCFVHELDADKLYGKGNMEELFEKPFPKTKADGVLREGKYEFLGIPVEVLHTPGHTSGSCCFIIDGNLFSGDTLFDNGYGRCDLADGNFTAMKQSLRKLKPYFNLPRYAGHTY